MEKQRDKAAKRVERKLAKEAGVTEPDDLDIELDEFGVPRERPDALDQAGPPGEAGPAGEAGSASEAGSAERPQKVEPKE